MTAARTRIGKVTLKGGASLSILPTPTGDRGAMLRHVREVFDRHPDPVGFAVAVWDEDGSSTCYAAAGDRNRIPTILIPDFVRNRLLADRIERWTLDNINGD